MKFLDGAWLMQPRIHAHYPVSVHDARREGDALVVAVPTRPIRHRGDMLQGPLLTYTFTAPREGVILVRVQHHASERRAPQLPLLRRDVEPVIEIDEQQARFTSGGLTVSVQRIGEWQLTFSAGGKVLTTSEAKDSGWVERVNEPPCMQAALSLGVGENVYGLGERFTAFVKNGQVVENTNKDGGTSTEQAYKAIPFYLTNRGYGVLVNETGPVSFEVASERVSRVQFSLPGESLEFCMVQGPTPKDVLSRLTALTGRPALPPAWSFGLWLTTSFLTDYDEATVMRFIDGMAERRLPLHVFHFDCFWMREFEWCSFQWDPRTFPDPVGMLRRLHERGLKVCVWINPYIAQRSPLFAEGKEGGYFLKRADGSVWQSDLWQPGMAIVDFTNPAACAWYAGHLRRLLEMGVDCFKSDFGERIPTDVVYHDGSDPVAMHNFYAVRYNEVVFRLLEEVRGAGEAVLFARSSYATGQRLPVHWGGDCWSSFESMAETLRGGLSLGLCGFGYWSHDIGGFDGETRPDVYKRWVPFGLLSSHSRLHGSTSYRVPWNFDEEACEVLRTFTRLKCGLMPYLYAQALVAHESGVPMMRAMLLEFPDEPGCDSLDRQYMLGDALLVAPVFSADGEVSYYLPAAGRWTHLLTGETREGGRWHRERHGFRSLPLYVRPGTVIAFGAEEERPDYRYTDGVRFCVFELAAGAATHARVANIGGTDAVECTVERRGDEYHVSLSGPPPDAWSVQLVGVKAAKADGKIETNALGVVIHAGRGARSLSVRAS